MFKRLNVLLMVILIAGFALVSCVPNGSTSDESSEIISEKNGGVLRCANLPPTKMDPAFMSMIAEGHIVRQWADFLVYIDENNQPDLERGLAKHWEVDETGTVWTFKIREGVKFHDGKELTSSDVKFTFDRLRDPNVGAVTVDLYSGIEEISTPDNYTVVFKLKDTNPDFLMDLGDYHAVILDADNTDYATNWNGTGPFYIDEYIPEDRIIFKRNPNYWLKDQDGHALPYLDGMEFLLLSDPSAQIEALRSGQVDYLIHVPTELVSVIEDDPDINILRKPSNTTWVIRIRSDRPPANDVRVRQALKAGTNNKELLEGAIHGFGVIGYNTPFGPTHGDYFLEVPEPICDVEKAKKLLADAGYADGLEITLYVQEQSPVPAMATIWKEQMAKIGVTVNIQLVPADIYFGADNMWLEVDFGITDWSARPYPQPYLDMAYITDAPWNECHWSDPEIDELADLASKEMNHDERVKLYHRIQEIFIERGPIIVPFFVDNLWGARTDVKGLRPTSYLGFALDLRYVYLEE